MKSKPVIQAIEVMPPLSHYPDKTKPFDILNSEVIKHLISLPAVQQHVFGMARDNKLIQFDPTSGKWTGRKWKQ